MHFNYNRPCFGCRFLFSFSSFSSFTSSISFSHPILFFFSLLYHSPSSFQHSLISRRREIMTLSLVHAILMEVESVGGIFVENWSAVELTTLHKSYYNLGLQTWPVALGEPKYSVFTCQRLPHFCMLTYTLVHAYAYSSGCIVKRYSRNSFQVVSRKVMFFKWKWLCVLDSLVTVLVRWVLCVLVLSYSFLLSYPPLFLSFSSSFITITCSSSLPI